MVKKELIKESVQNLCDGKGLTHIHHWMKDNAMPSNVNLMSSVVMEKDASIGNHSHIGEAEVYFIQSGKGMYYDNGAEVEVTTGDVLICYDGECHGIINTQDEQLVFTAIIIKS